MQSVTRAIAHRLENNMSLKTDYKQLENAWLEFLGTIDGGDYFDDDNEPAQRALTKLSKKIRKIKELSEVTR